MIANKTVYGVYEVARVSSPEWNALDAPWSPFIWPLLLWQPKSYLSLYLQTAPHYPNTHKLVSRQRICSLAAHSAGRFELPKKEL